MSKKLYAVTEDYASEVSFEDAATWVEGGEQRNMPDGDWVLAFAVDRSAAIELATRFDLGQIQPDNITRDGHTVGALYEQN